MWYSAGRPCKCSLTGHLWRSGDDHVDARTGESKRNRHSRRKPVFAPISIRLAGLLGVATGVSSIFGMIAQFVSGKFVLDLGFVFIGLGWGLMAGRPSSRNLLIFLFGCASLFCASLAIWMTYEYFNSSASDANLTNNGIAQIVTSGLLTSFVVATLCRTRIRSWFNTPRLAPAIGASWTLPAALAFAVVLGQQTLRDWQPPPRQPFPIFTTVTVRDAETGEKIDSVSFLPKQESMGGTWPPSLRVSTRGTRDEGIQLKFKGAVTEPIEITLAAEGYSPQTVELTESSPELMTVKLTRKP